MPLSYAKNKVHIYNYVEANRNKHNEYQNEYRRLNNEEYNRIRRNTYNYNKVSTYEYEVKRLMSIKI